MTSEPTDGPVVEENTSWQWTCSWCSVVSTGYSFRAGAEIDAEVHREICPKRPRPVPTVAQINEALAPLGVRVECTTVKANADFLYRIVQRQGS